MTIEICTDAGSCDYTSEDGWSVPEALDDFFLDMSGKRGIQSVQQAEDYLNRVGGYGSIKIDGETVMDIPS